MQRAPHHPVAVTPERLLAFGDAVFAIAITLLALDIGIPEGLRDAQVPGALHEALPEAGAYLLSFGVIGIQWLTQHALFAYVGRIDRCFVNLQLALLAVIAGLPFPTKLISEYGSTALGTSVYAGAIALAALLSVLMGLRLLLRPELRASGTSRAALTVFIGHGAVVCAAFATSVPISLLSPTAAKYWWLTATLSRLWPGGREVDAAADAATATTAD